MDGSGIRHALSEAATWAGWLLVAAMFCAGVYYFNDLQQLSRNWIGGTEPYVAETAPASFDRFERVAADDRGHYSVDGEIDGEAISFMTDTGATVVVIGYEEADRIGLRPHTLEFSGVSRTANGQARVAPIVIDRLRVGEIEVRDVQAMVAEEGKLHVNLLGMSFLGRLSRFEIENGELVLTQ